MLNYKCVNEIYRFCKQNNKILFIAARQSDKPHPKTFQVVLATIN